MMSNDREDKYEGHEESEYHFSDEEVSYEVESEPPKQTAVSGEGKQGIVARLSQSKRMLISLGVFLVLVFVVYKMVAPTSSVPSTDIAAAPPTVTQQPGISTASAQNQVAAVGQAQVVSGPSTPTPLPPTANVAQTNPSTVAMTPPVQTLASPPILQAQAPQSPNTAIPPTPTMPLSSLPVPVVPSATQAQAPAIAQQAGVPPTQQQQIIASLPTVIPVQSTVLAYNNNNQTVGFIPPVTTSSAVASTDANAANLAANSEKLMMQLQNQYSQQFSDFSTQNKALQDQVQALNSRVVVMEGQLNQLVQVLTRRGSGNAMASPAASMPRPQAVEPRIVYNVQAIIPGRAWLKSENGETLTVAEGDMIKDFGRVTKIDPYDGVVEVNTGSKAISLSYGNGG